MSAGATAASGRAVEDLLDALRAIVGADQVHAGPAERIAYSYDGTFPQDVPLAAVTPASTEEVAAVLALASAHTVPVHTRGAATSLSGGAVPIGGGLVLSLVRMNTIVEIDPGDSVVVAQPGVITADLQRAVEAVGLFYPPDPASLNQSSIGGNVAECAGGPRAFKYGTTKRYVLALEAVLPTGDVIETGSKAVKNVVGYDLTQLLVGSEGTLAIITKVTLRLVPKPRANATMLATFDGIAGAVDAVSELIRRRVVPAALELIDGDSLAAIEQNLGGGLVAPGTAAALIVEVDGTERGVEEDLDAVVEACRSLGAKDISRARNEAERDTIWSLRRQISVALKATGLVKINHDVVVPRGRVPELFDVIAELKRTYSLRVAAFGHAGDGNIHVNLLLRPGDAEEAARAKQAERFLFTRVVELEGSISGEHGIGFAKAPYLPIELSAEEIALMKRIKAAFDPNGILNPSKIFP
jgi:glycolate oxidase